MYIARKDRRMLKERVCCSEGKETMSIRWGI